VVCHKDYAALGRVIASRDQKQNRTPKIVPQTLAKMHSTCVGLTVQQEKTAAMRMGRKLGEPGADISMDLSAPLGNWNNLWCFVLQTSRWGNLHRERAFGQDFPSNRNRLLNQLAASLSNCRPSFCLPILAASLSN